MSTLDNRKEELSNRIQELETALGGLKSQLHEIEEIEQHEAIDNLERYLDQVDHKFRNLGDLWTLLVDEMKGLFGR
ncbi:MAG: hypothetical protein MPN21_09505 [Thermoanaerobaculia bacterium]|nr:hypothetical protein [Thermoanaerobaculia bacterium]